MSTPKHFIDLIVDSGQEIDRRFPGLRESYVEEWMAKVCYLASLTDVRTGRKARDASARVSPDTAGFKEESTNSDTAPFYAVSIIRDDQDNGNPWRAKPIDHGLVSGQLWILPKPVDLGEGEGPPEPSDTEQRLNSLETWARNLGYKG